MGRSYPHRSYPHKCGGAGSLTASRPATVCQLLRCPAVDPVPVGLTLNATRRRGLVAQSGLGNPVAAAFADPVSAFSQALERALDLLPVLVEKVHQEVGGL